MMITYNYVKLVTPIILFSASLFFACNNTEQKPKPINEQVLKERMISANKYLSRSENEEIDAYVKRRGLPVVLSKTGVRYYIYEKGKGTTLKQGDRLFLKYKLSFLNGQLCYDSDKDGLMQIEIGKSGVTGLNEVLLLLKHGDKARLIVPSYLGYGLMGDEKKIPTKATLVYDIEIPN